MCGPMLIHACSSAGVTDAPRHLIFYSRSSILGLFTWVIGTTVFLTPSENASPYQQQKPQNQNPKQYSNKSFYPQETISSSWSVTQPFENTYHNSVSFTHTPSPSLISIFPSTESQIVVSLFTVNVPYILSTPGRDTGKGIGGWVEHRKSTKGSLSFRSQIIPPEECAMVVFTSFTLLC